MNKTTTKRRVLCRKLSAWEGKCLIQIAAPRKRQAHREVWRLCRRHAHPRTLTLGAHRERPRLRRRRHHCQEALRSWRQEFAVAFEALRVDVVYLRDAFAATRRTAEKLSVVGSHHTW